MILKLRKQKIGVIMKSIVLLYSQNFIATSSLKLNKLSIAKLTILCNQMKNLNIIG